MIRVISEEYESVTGELSFSPGNLLYSSYKNYIKGRCPKELEIIDQPNNLKKALLEVKKAIIYETDPE